MQLNGHSHPVGSTRKAPATGYAIWAYRDGVWSLSADRSQPGYEPGGAPDHQGEYEGEVVRMLSVPSTH
jgi:hypothetical protein